MDSKELLNKYLNNAFVVLSNLYGMPPKKFDFEYRSFNGDLIIVRDLTPKSFYKNIVIF